MHAAADGGLARVRVPGGRLTTSQLRELAGAASAYGSGVIELTSRANVQVRGLGEGTAFANRMAAAGLLPSPTHERIRNVLASPLTGLDGGGLTDVTPLVAELDRRLCALPGLAALPGRFMFALDDGRGDVAGLGADATILPTGPDEAAVILAGADSGLRVPLDAAVWALLAAAEAFLAELAAQEITAWRIGELDDGPARVAARLRTRLAEGSPPLDHDPVRATARTHTRPGEDRPLPDHDPAQVTARTHASPASAEPVDPSRLRPVGLGPVGVIEQSPAPTGAPVRNDPTGPRAGADTGRRVALGVAVPLGRLTSAQAELLADVASLGEVRLTPWRGMVLPGLAPDEVAGTAARLAEAGLVTDPASPWIGVTACTGRPGCAKSLADVQADAALAITSVRNDPTGPEAGAETGIGSGARAGSETDPGIEDGIGAGTGSRIGPGAGALAKSGSEARAESVVSGSGEVTPYVVDSPRTGTLPVHWAGCERRCGRPRGRVADVVATGDGYRLDLDGRSLTCADIEETAAAMTAARGEM
ncbi:precorrin-3B synthase [Streptosporangium subroseum]|uniref:Precorrin-3B synthase n=1 Tax=Streptosporangium subroseum TaxID=106412 RepID=A0A239IZG3_9ACTN|nr:precorrin-3B synthase [Streptosporangium subroseum]